MQDIRTQRLIKMHTFTTQPVLSIKQRGGGGDGVVTPQNKKKKRMKMKKKKRQCKN